MNHLMPPVFIELRYVMKGPVDRLVLVMTRTDSLLVLNEVYGMLKKLGESPGGN